jgi:hypothetical protein
VTITPSPTTISGTGENLGTTPTSKTTLNSTVVTWTGLDGSKKTGNMYVY